VETWDLQSEHGNTEGQEESLCERVNWAKDVNLLDEDCVPQESHHQCQQNNPDEKDNKVIDELLTIA
jgi:hypothetical protein